MTFLITDIGLDIQDDLGRHEVGFVENTVKTPIGEDGCMFEANFLVNKVPGKGEMILLRFFFVQSICKCNCWQINA